MGRSEATTSEAVSVDREIQKTNALQKEYGLPPIFTVPAFDYKAYRTLLRANGELKVKPAFTGRDKILLHFNRVTKDEKVPPEEKLRSKYVDHISTLKFGSKYAARHFIERIIEEASVAVPKPTRTWKGPNRLHINDWILISSDEDSEEDLEDIMGDDLTKEEQKWKLPHPYDQYASFIARYNHGIHPQINIKTRDDKTNPEDYDDGKKNYGDNRRAPRPEKEVEEAARRKEKKNREDKPKSKPSLDGLTTIAAIASSLKIEPGEARKILRASKTPKPSSGNWAWPKSEVEAITKILKKGMK